MKYDSVWVLVTPSSSNAYVYITAYASAYSSSSSLISLSDGVIQLLIKFKLIIINQIKYYFNII